MFDILKLFKGDQKVRPIPLFTDLKCTIRVVSQWLDQNGWTLVPANDLYVYTSLVARKGATVLAIRCSGTDYRLLTTAIKDLRTAALQRACHPVYIYGEQKDPRWWREAREGADIILSVHDIDKLEAAILESSPVILGSAEVRPPSTIQGWVRLSPTGQATLSAYLGDECIGTCVADSLKQTTDIKNAGEFRFKLPINKPMTQLEIQERVILKAFRGETYIAPIPILKKPIISTT